MRKAVDLLSQYAAGHRDRRNIATHLVGVPLIVFSIGVLLARPAFRLGGFELTPVHILWVLTTLWYLTRGDVALGLAVSLANALLAALAHPLAGGGTAVWLGWGVGIFVAGWVIQFLGHWYEGRRPAFVDDLAGLLIAPMFVAAEAMFALGWHKRLMAEIERRVGPTVLRDLAAVRG